MKALRRKWYGLVTVCGTTLVLGGCLSDQELTQIFSSVITTGLSTVLQQLVIGLTGGTGA